MEPMKTVPAATVRTKIFTHKLLENFSIWTRLCIISVFLYTGLSTQEGFSFNNEGSRIECNFIATAPVFNVDDYGAKGDCVTDDSQAFGAAWNAAVAAACNSSSDSVFLVPNGKCYLVKPINFTGPCNCVNLTAQISGRIVAHPDTCRRNLHAPQEWLMFSKVQGLTMSGGGIIDGTDRNHSCPSVPTALVVNSSSKFVHLSNLTFHVSPKIHVEIAQTTFQTTYVQAENLKIVAPGDSPDTDGIHVYASQHVVIQNCTIATGDDSVSIVEGSSDIQIDQLVCGPGYSLIASQNGVFLETGQLINYAPQGTIFQHVRMTNVANPIIMDQYYCAPPSPCHNQLKPCNNHSSAVRVSGSLPSTKIVMEGVSVRADSGDPATSLSDNVQGSSDGQVIPPVKFTLPGLEATD